MIETPGHAPSHVCLFQPERRILISGDHLLGRISLYYDYGWTPDPVGEFLRSLDAVEALRPAPRLCLAGHARPFTDVQAHIEANRELVAQRVGATAVAIESQPLTAYEVVPLVHGERRGPRRRVAADRDALLPAPSRGDRRRAARARRPRALGLGLRTSAVARRGALR